MKRHPIRRLVMLAAAGVPGGIMCNASAAVVSVFMQGTVESALFGADAVFPVGTPVSFVVSYEADPQINPDLDARATWGFFKFIRWEFVGVGGTSAGQFNGISIGNEAIDSVQFGVGSVQLPPLGNYSFDHGTLQFSDLTGTMLDSTALPAAIPPGWFGGGTFQVRWGGATGFTISGPLQVVPEPTTILLLSSLLPALFWRRRR